MIDACHYVSQQTQIYASCHEDTVELSAIIYNYINHCSATLPCQDVSISI